MCVPSSPLFVAALPLVEKERIWKTGYSGRTRTKNRQEEKKSKCDPSRLFVKPQLSEFQE